MHAVGLVVEGSLNWLFREHPTGDFGIDAHVEVVRDGRATGRLLGLQIKSGSSYFEQTTPGGVTYYGDHAHLSYWLNHSLPVAVVLYEPSKRKAYWQAVSPSTVQYTERRWKLLVPWVNELGPAAKPILERHAEGDPLMLWFRRLELERSWMERVRQGEALLLEIDEWVNKSSGRGDIRLVVVDRHAANRVVRDWPFRLFPGAEYKELIPQLFPWASIEIDEDTYDRAEEEQWREEEGVWDSEDGRYILVGDTFEDWRARRGLSGLRPYEIGDEVAHWRLRLTLGPLGEAFLTLHDFLQEQLEGEP